MSRSGPAGRAVAPSSPLYVALKTLERVVQRHRRRANWRVRAVYSGASSRPGGPVDGEHVGREGGHRLLVLRSPAVCRWASGGPLIWRRRAYRQRRAVPAPACAQRAEASFCVFFVLFSPESFDLPPDCSRFGTALRTCCRRGCMRACSDAPIDAQVPQWLAWQLGPWRVFRAPPAAPLRICCPDRSCILPFGFDPSGGGQNVDELTGWLTPRYATRYSNACWEPFRCARPRRNRRCSPCVRATTTCRSMARTTTTHHRAAALAGHAALAPVKTNRIAELRKQRAEIDAELTLKRTPRPRSSRSARSTTPLTPETGRPSPPYWPTTSSMRTCYWASPRSVEARRFSGALSGDPAFVSKKLNLPFDLQLIVDKVACDGQSRWASNGTSGRRQPSSLVGYRWRRRT